jgi:hypothetical protein
VPATHLLVIEDDVAMRVAPDHREGLIERTDFDPAADPVFDLDLQRPLHATGIQEEIHVVR